MNKQIFRALLIALLGQLSVVTYSSEGEGKLELVAHMKQLQYFAHKLQLSIEADNRKLAGFYAHELEEVIEKVERVSSYDNHPVGDMTKTILLPAFETLEKSIKGKAGGLAMKNFNNLVNACNKCHSLTDHGYIVIRKNSNNPYMQSFQE